MSIKEFIEKNKELLFSLVKELCLIPAPSGFEDKRGEFCKAWFTKNGISGVYIDSAKNVIVPYKVKKDSKLTVFVAHTDTVFPDREPMPYLDDGEYIHCPGVGDDTANLAVLMLVAKYFFENDIDTEGVLFVANSSEEGLGNLRGTRQLWRDFGDRIESFVSFDNFSLDGAVDGCVGSHRYELTLKTEGGHSWENFGNKSAIAELSRIVNAIYSIELPKKEGCKVSFNVGIIEGGTSVNTIAEEAKLLCEYRADDLWLLDFMKSKFEEIFNESAGREGVSLSVNMVGERPCAGFVDPEKMEKMREILRLAVKKVIGKDVSFHSGSTDCNIPMSYGIPAICIATCESYGPHKREEKLKKSSLIPGLEIALLASIEYAK